MKINHEYNIFLFYEYASTWGVSFSIVMGLFVDRMDNLNSSFPLNCSLWGCQMCVGWELANIKVTLVHF